MGKCKERPGEPGKRPPAPEPIKGAENLKLLSKEEHEKQNKGAFAAAKEIVKRIGGHIPERVIIDEIHEIPIQPPEIIIRPEQQTRTIITMSLEKYIELKVQSGYLKGKEESVEERIDLARDAGYYYGRSSVFEDLLEKDQEEPAPIILSVEKEIERYKQNIITKLQNEINRLNNMLQKDRGEIELEPYYRINGNIEGLEKAIRAIKGE